MDHVGAQPGAPLTLRVYPGGHGAFTLYQDAGSGTGYQKGQYSLTTVTTAPGAGAGVRACHDSRSADPGWPEPDGASTVVIS